MKYLFFDVECSNCFNKVGKICEFGYVLTDENFNIIQTDDIPMSPGKGRGNRFHLTGRTGQKDLILAYDYDYYLEQPEFPHFYQRIKALMEDGDTICFAYSMGDDISYLQQTCRRYRLKPLSYTCYDVQMLAMRYLGQSKQMRQHDACIQIVGPHSVISLQEHLARDDAKMEQMIFDAICTLSNKTSSQMLAESDFAKTNSIEFMEKIEEKQREKERVHKAWVKINSMALDAPEVTKPEYAGRRYFISATVWEHHTEWLQSVIDSIKKREGVVTMKSSYADFYVVWDEDDRQGIIRNRKAPYEGTFIEYKELLDL